MSFRQDRTNPSSAVSNWHGRSETPKGWPSTRVSTWVNSGLFGGGGGANTWFGIYSFNSQTSISDGAKYPCPARPWEKQTNAPLMSNGSIPMRGTYTGNDQYMFYELKEDGTVAENAARIGQYSVTNGEWRQYAMTTNGSDIMLMGGSMKYTPSSNNRIMPGLVVSPLSDINTAGTPTIEDHECYNLNGSSWASDQFRTIHVYNEDTANNMIYWCLAGKPLGYTGWVFGTYDTSSDSIACTGYARTYGGDWGTDGTHWVCQGGSGRMYGFVQGAQGRPSVFMSNATSESSSNAYQRMYAQAWAKNVTYTSYGRPGAVYYLGQYSGNDQFFVMYSVQQLYGAAETYIAKMTPYDGNVQSNKLIYASNNQGNMQPPEFAGMTTGAVIDSSGNIYLIMDRTGLMSNRECVVMKLNSSFTVQWTRVMQASASATWNTQVGNAKQLECTGITLSADENYLVVHGTMEYLPSSGQYRKAFAFRVPADGSGAMANNLPAHKLEYGADSVTPTTRNDFVNDNYFVRYYDPADTSASPNPRPVNETSFGGNWGSATANGNVNYGGNQSAATKPGFSTALGNQAITYGNYAYPNLFEG